MSTDTLFPIPPCVPSSASPSDSEAPPRLRTANRNQIELRPCDLESLLPPDHCARSIWSVVEQLDLSAFYAAIAARGSRAGRSATDPKILVTLWLYATKEGLGNAREMARLCECHDAYRWICGGVPVNHHTLSDFRTEHVEALDGLMTQVLAVLLHQGVVTLERVAQDGMRVRASASSASFRREPSLKECLADAEAQVAQVKQQAESDAEGSSSRQRAAQARAAREREQRVQQALAELPKVRAIKHSEDERERARTSTTDPEARVMKMADGGFRPGYNVQFASDTASHTIVGVDVTNAGSDLNEMTPMLTSIEARTGRRPSEHLVDGGFVNLTAIEQAASQGVQVLAPVKAPQAAGVDRYAAKPGDGVGVAAWRVRMGTEAGRATYKLRASTAELTNAQMRSQRGLDRVRVRGRRKVLALALWAALTHNVLRALALGVWT